MNAGVADKRAAFVQTLLVGTIALAGRLAVVAWAAGRFPPTGDGTYYDALAHRLSAGLGYTWQWPDGAVTFAAHYPVGYPALLASVYALGGSITGAMALNALIGSAAAVAVHRLALRATSHRRAAVAGVLVALHPGLVMYTPALMTEGVAGAALVIAAAIAAIARARGRLAIGSASIGVAIGVATLLRPQLLLAAPVFAALAFAGGRWSARQTAAAALIAGAAALATCAPWTARNCVRMNRCALVSVNGGWNLLIGADARSTGAWSPIDVPPACREVWDEAEKDRCFQRAALDFIRREPVTWIGLVPKKLAATFDYVGAAGWYLHASNPEAFDDRDKRVLGVVETVFERIALLFGLAWAARRDGDPRPRARIGVAALGAVFALTPAGWVGYVALVVAASLRGRALVRGPLLPSTAVASVALTLGTHAVFFGSGRYALVALPLSTALAALAIGARADGPPAARQPAF